MFDKLNFNGENTNIDSQTFSVHKIHKSQNVSLLLETLSQIILTVVLVFDLRKYIINIIKI